MEEISVNKIKFTANKDANYVYHMLSIAKCGYDNDYGRRYRGLYPAEDLEILKKHEDLITVCGGEHCGELYSLLAAEPACGYIPAKDQYAGLIKMAEDGEVPPESVKYIDTVREIAEVMIKHYDHYVNEIWEAEEAKIVSYIPTVEELFEVSGFSDKAEELVGQVLPVRYFIATLVTSVSGGAEAINVSMEQDLFGIDRTAEEEFAFIGHEFIIYLLLEALKGEEAFKEHDTWNLTEGLAEFFLRKLIGKVLPWSECEEYIELYEKLWGEGCKSAVELYRKAYEVRR